MQLITGKTAGVAALALGLLASAGLAKSVDARTPGVVAQAATPTPESNKERITNLRTCRAYNRALRGFRSDYNDMANILPDIPTTDDLYPKVVALRTQLNDARVTAEKRIADICPGFKG